MWAPSTDFSYGFGAGISFFIVIEVIRCIREACCKKQEPQQPTLPVTTPMLPIGLPPVVARMR